MHNYIKVSLNALFIFACVFFYSCKDQDAVAPQEDQVVENNDVLQKIKSLGFTENQIKETPNYYLADGDLYFSKKISSNITTPGKKNARRIMEKYATITVHVGESLAGVIDEHWRAGIDQAIAEWNANEEVHFHFALTNSTDANINIVKDTDLPKDLAIASEFPRDGRTGSSIRINVAATTVVKDAKQAFARALEHCVGVLHSTSVTNKNVKTNSNALKSATHSERFTNELYAIKGNILYQIDGETGKYYSVSGGWAGTEVMGQSAGFLYMVQFGTLYRVNPSSGNYDALTSGWEGSQYITDIPGLNILTSKLYIIQDSWIWPVDPITGVWGEAIGKYTLARGLVSYSDYYDNNKYKLAVLKRKSGSSTVSLLYVINPTNGQLYFQTTIPASGVDRWNGKFLLLNSQSHLYIFNGMANSINQDNGQYRGGWGDFANMEIVAPYHPVDPYYIRGASLYRLVPNGSLPPYNELLGKLGDWAGTSCLVYLSK